MKNNILVLLSLILIISSCRTPEQLIDKAIKKDPTIVNGFKDTLTLTRIKHDSIPYIVEGEIRYRDTTITEYYDTVINCDLIEIERKKTRFEQRKNYKLQKRAQDLQFKLDKKQKEIDKLKTRLNARNERKSDKQEQKTQRTITRKENKRGCTWLFLIGFGLGVMGPKIIRLIKSRFLL